jgi:hypothetical protein
MDKCERREGARQTIYWILGLIATANAFAALTGCGGSQHLAPGGSSAYDAHGATPLEQALPWPPSGVVRHVSDYQTQLYGSEWSAKSAAASNEGDALRLTGGSGLPWAVYAVSGLEAFNRLTAVAATFSIEPESPGDGTALYAAVANYSIGAWEWHPAQSPSFVLGIDQGDDYTNPSGAAYLALALAGPGEALVESVYFSHTGLGSGPRHLTGEVTGLGVVELSWDAIEGATGYNVYRSRNQNLGSPEKLNETPLAATEFIDNTPLTGYYYWYWATAVADNESGRGNVVRLWLWEADLPAPANLRVTERGVDSFTLAWDWDEPNPATGFMLYLNTVPDFLITDETAPDFEKDWIISPYGREFTKTPRQTGAQYYWKMCALGPGKARGWLSAEATASAFGTWTWGNVATIAEGSVPLRATRADGEMAVAFFNGTSVDIAVRDQGTWSSETALVGGDGRWYGDYLDLAYGGGLYIAVTCEASAGDAYSVYGGPGDWLRHCVDGDGGTGIPHEVSGLYIRVAASDNELAVIHYDLSVSALRLHTKTFEHYSWSREIIESFGSNNILDHDLAFLDGNLFVLSSDVQSDELRLASSANPWRFDPVLEDGAPELTQYINMVRCGDAWYATGFDRANKDLYILTGDELPWSDTRIAENGGYEARLATEGDEVAVIYRADNQLQFATLSADWQAGPVAIPGVSHLNATCDVVLLNGLAYVFFRDKDDGMIKVVQGTPPGE